MRKSLFIGAVSGWKLLTASSCKGSIFICETKSAASRATLLLKRDFKNLLDGLLQGALEERAALAGCVVDRNLDFVGIVVRVVNLLQALFLSCLASLDGEVVVGSVVTGEHHIVQARGGSRGD